MNNYLDNSINDLSNSSSHSLYTVDENKSIIDEIKSNSSSQSSYLDLVTFKLRGRAEWWELKHSEIFINEKIGVGGSGIINKAKWRGLECVVKCLKHNNNDTEYNDLINEISIISHLRHPNLVLFLGACTISDPLLLIYEYMPNGSLDTYYNLMSIKTNKIWVPKNDIINRWLLELAQAIYFLHHCYYPIMHRDIKPSNILLSENLHIKIADFGLSKTIKKKHEKYKMSSCAGTLRYMAPEVMLYNNDIKYDLKIDIYSLSLNYWFICSGIVPFKELDYNENVYHIIKNGYRPNINTIRYNIPKLKKLITNMWDNNPINRPDIDNVLKIIETLEPYYIKSNKYCNII